MHLQQTGKSSHAYRQADYQSCLSQSNGDQWKTRSIWIVLYILKILMFVKLNKIMNANDI